MHKLKSLIQIIVISTLLAACVTTGEDATLQKALAGDVSSQYKMGLRYNNGQGVQQNYSTALEWFEKSAASGNAEAQYFAGIAYDAGRGVEQNLEKAVVYFSGAANQGHARAQYQYAQTFMNARGATKDQRWAVVWYDKSANQKHSGSMFMLGVAYAAGLGVDPSNVVSWAWLDLAAKDNYPNANTARDTMGQKLSDDELAAAMKVSVLRENSQNSEFADTPMIRYVQYGLVQLGFAAGTVDGVYGPNTDKAVREFRAQLGLNVNAGITPQMVDELRKQMKLNQTS